MHFTGRIDLADVLESQHLSRSWIHHHPCRQNCGKCQGIQFMLKLEQLAAVVVAAGLAIVSYMLFFSVAGGGGYERRDPASDQAALIRFRDRPSP
jgi:hypothetical protein